MPQSITMWGIKRQINVCWVAANFQASVFMLLNLLFIFHCQFAKKNEKIQNHAGDRDASFDSITTETSKHVNLDT